MSDPFYDGLDDDALPERGWASPGQHIEPVQIEIVRVCEWKAKPCGLCGKPKSNKIHNKSTGSCRFARKLGCERCGKPKSHVDHLGAPESFNLFASGSWEAYQSAKKRWHAVLGPLLRASGLPGGLAYVLVEGEVSFGDDRPRDQGNHRVVPEKAIGDVLKELGYLEDDKWHQYEFGGLTRVEQPGVNRLRLTFFPRAPALPAEPAQGELL